MVPIPFITYAILFFFLDLTILEKDDRLDIGSPTIFRSKKGYKKPGKIIVEADYHRSLPESKGLRVIDEFLS